MTSEQALERAAEVIRDCFHCPDKRIVRSTVADDVLGWDSLAHTMVVMRLEEVFGVELPLDRVFLVKNVGELVDLLLEAGPA